MNLHLNRTNAFIGAAIALIGITAILILTLAPKASAVTTDCPAGYVCFWTGKQFGGQQAFFAGSETGCKSLANIDPGSMRNHTGNKSVTFFPAGTPIGPGSEIAFGDHGYTGSACID